MHEFKKSLQLVSNEFLEQVIAYMNALNLVKSPGYSLPWIYLHGNKRDQKKKKKNIKEAA